MILTEFNKELYEQGLKEDAWEEGLEKGREAGKILGKTETLVSLVKKGRITLEEAAEEAGIDAKSFEKLLIKGE